MRFLARTWIDMVNSSVAQQKWFSAWLSIKPPTESNKTSAYKKLQLYYDGKTKSRPGSKECFTVGHYKWCLSKQETSKDTIMCQTQVITVGASRPVNSCSFEISRAAFI